MKQKELFDDQMMDEWPVLELYQPVPAVMKNVEEMIRCLSVAELLLRAETFRPLLKKKRVVVADKGGIATTIEVIARFQQKKSGYVKKDLLSFLSFFLADHRNFKIYLESLSEGVQWLWRMTITFYYVSHTQLYRVTGKKWIKSNNRHSYYYYDLPKSEELAWFSCIMDKAEGMGDFGQKNRDYYFYLSSLLYAHLQPVFFPENQCALVPQKELPTDQTWHLFNGESNILCELAVLKSLHAQGMLEMKRNKIAVAMLRKVIKQLNMLEFFPEQMDTGFSLLRASLAIPFYAFYQTTDPSAIGDEPEEVLKELLEEILLDPSVLVTVILNYVSGFRSNILMSSYACPQASHILKILTAQNSLDWMSVPHICLALRKDGASTYNNLLFFRSDFEKMDLVNQKVRDEVHLDNCYAEIGVPFVKGFLFTLAAFGLVEIAFTDPKPDAISYYDSLHYIRLTALGAYVLGLTTEYTAQTIPDQTTYFELDPTKLLIRALGERNPYEPLLDDISHFIGNHRYSVTYTSFLKNCATAADITDKINFFKQYISSDLPENWVQFFATLSRKVNPMTYIPTSRYLVYQIGEANKDFQRLISSDPILRQYTVRAENYLLLVESGHQKQVIERLKEFGYLL